MRRNLLFTAVLVAAAIGLTAAIALAHTKVSSTSPPRGGSAKTSIESVKVTFSGPIRRGTIRVTGPGGRKASRGTGGRDPRNVKRLIVELKSSLSTGRYKASWTMTAADGHKQDGSFRFRLKR